METHMPLLPNNVAGLPTDLKGGSGYLGLFPQSCPLLACAAPPQCRLCPYVLPFLHCL